MISPGFPQHSLAILQAGRTAYALNLFFEPETTVEKKREKENKKKTKQRKTKRRRNMNISGRKDTIEARAIYPKKGKLFVFSMHKSCVSFLTHAIACLVKTPQRQAMLSLHPCPPLALPPEIWCVARREPLLRITQDCLPGIRATQVQTTVPPGMTNAR